MIERSLKARLLLCCAQLAFLPSALHLRNFENPMEHFMTLKKWIVLGHEISQYIELLEIVIDASLLKSA
jgi:hypothetical protein